MAIEQTLVLVKPDGAKRRLTLRNKLGSETCHHVAKARPLERAANGIHQPSESLLERRHYRVLDIAQEVADTIQARDVKLAAAYERTNDRGLKSVSIISEYIPFKTRAYPLLDLGDIPTGFPGCSGLRHYLQFDLA